MSQFCCYNARKVRGDIKLTPPQTVNVQLTTNNAIKSAAVEVAPSSGGAFRIFVAGCGGDECAEEHDGRYISHIGGGLHPADGSGTTFILSDDSERLTDASGRFTAAVDAFGTGSQLFMADQQMLADYDLSPLRCYVGGMERLQCEAPGLVEMALCTVETTGSGSETKVSLVSETDNNHSCPLAVLYVEPEQAFVHATE